MLDEFFRKAFREKFYASLDALQADLDAWLHHNNYEREDARSRRLNLEKRIGKN